MNPGERRILVRLRRTRELALWACLVEAAAMVLLLVAVLAGRL